MHINVFHRALYLTGPTASGKTAVGVALAERLGAEVLALDSMTLYRGLDIGTAKPRWEETCGVPHHLIDLLDPWEHADVAQYRAWAAHAAAAVEARGRRVLFVGGTCLYLKTLLRGLFEGPGSDPALRAELEAEADRLGAVAFHQHLAVVDPDTARRLHPKDRRRIVRALEVHRLTGRPLSDWQREHDRPAPANVPVLALERPRAALNRRIDARVVAMFEAGLVDEVQGLIEAPRQLHPVPAQGVGYKEVIDYLEGRIPTLPETIARVQTRTRQFAKRQRTWFRGLEEVERAPIEPDESPEALADRLVQRIDEIEARH